MKTTAFVLAGCLLAGRSLHGQSAPVASLSLVAQIDSIFASADRTDAPGCVLGVVREGRLVYRRGYGMADLERRVPMTSQTVVDIGSVSKQFTAMAAILLADRGRVSLDDPVRRYLPELPAYADPITLRQLIHHTSGLRDYLTLLRLSGLEFSDVAGDAEGLAMLERQRAPNFAPGEAYSYNNSGYFLLSLVVERVTGMSLREFAATEIFEPLGMINTRIHDYNSLVPNRAVGYSRRSDGGYGVELWRFTQTGDGAVFTTVEDLLHWDTNFYTGRVGGAAVAAEMYRTGVLNDGRAIDYAGGNQVTTYRGLRRVSHGGNGGGFNSTITRFPDQRLSVMVFCNQDPTDAGAKAQAVADLYLANAYTEPLPPAESRDAPAPPAAAAQPALPESELEHYAGEYWSEELAATYRITLKDGALMLRIGRGLDQALEPRGKDLFGVWFGTLAFARDARGRIGGFALTVGETRNLVFTRTTR